MNYFYYNKKKKKKKLMIKFNMFIVVIYLCICKGKKISNNIPNIYI